MRGAPSRDLRKKPYNANQPGLQQAGPQPRSEAESQQFMHSMNRSEPLPCGGRYKGETLGHGQAAFQKLVKQAAVFRGWRALRIKF